MDKRDTVRKLFANYLANRKDLTDPLLTDDFAFSSPRDDHIDKAIYFERCWPQPPVFSHIVVERLFVSGDEVVVGYKGEKVAGGAFRNLELMIFRGDRIASIEVYFGRDV